MYKKTAQQAYKWWRRSELFRVKSENNFHVDSMIVEENLNAIWDRKCSAYGSFISLSRRHDIAISIETHNAHTGKISKRKVPLVMWLL